MRTKVVPMFCACGCGKDFFIPTKMAWRYPTDKYAFFRADCGSYPDNCVRVRREKYVVLEYAHQEEVQS